MYLKNTLLIVILRGGNHPGSAIVAYAFSRMQFPGREPLFAVLLSTMMLLAAVTLLPQFLIFRSFGWIDTLLALWVPAFFGSAFNIFLLRQFFLQIPMELEDASKIDGASYPRSFWSVMLPQIKPALAVIAIWTFMGAWNNFMGPLIYINSPENMPISYALQLFSSDRGAEPGAPHGVHRDGDPPRAGPLLLRPAVLHRGRDAERARGVSNGMASVARRAVVDEQGGIRIEDPSLKPGQVVRVILLPDSLDTPFNPVHPLCMGNDALRFR